MMGGRVSALPLSFQSKGEPMFKRFTSNGDWLVITLIVVAAIIVLVVFPI